MQSMPPHAAYGIDMERLDVIVVEDSKPMQTILRSMLATLRVARIRMFDDGMEALQAMLSEPPNVIISDWNMVPTSGYQLLRMIRHRQMEPLCFVPLIFVTAHGTRAVVEKAFRGGAHYLLVKPMSPATLHQRLMCLARDSRPFVRRGDHFVIEGVDTAIEDLQEKWQSLRRARAYHERNNKRAAEVQRFVDRIFNGELSLEDIDAGYFAASRRPEQPGKGESGQEKGAPKEAESETEDRNPWNFAHLIN